MYTKEQLKRIFNRIGLEYEEDMDTDCFLLSEVMYGCQKNIPYENLDIVMRRPLSLDYGDLYEKIVTNHRGGYCFELNGFLGEVYRSLGYPVTEYMARYLRGETEIPMRRHRVVCARDNEGRCWICDAGIGQAAFRLPLLLKDGFVSEQFGEVYKVVREDFYGWVIYDLHNGEWRRFYSFTEEEQLNIDYVMPSFWCENAPDSPFIGKLSFAIKTDTGRYTLDGDLFRCFDGETVTETKLGPEELAGVAREYFGIDLTPAE